MDKNIKFSIVCATKNEENDVLISLSSCINQSWKAHEIIYVDDSTDKTKDIIIQYYKYGVKLIEGEGNGCCAARNLGIVEATGDVIVFTNADIYLPSNYLEELNKIYCCEEVDMVVPDSIVMNMESIYARYVQYLDDVDKITRNSYTAQGYSVRRRHAVEVGMISVKKIPYNCCRDWTLGYKMQKSGYSKLFLNRYKIPHKCPDNFLEFWMVRKTRGMMSAYSKSYYSKFGILLAIAVAIARIIFFGVVYFSGYRIINVTFKYYSNFKSCKYEIFKFIYADTINTLAFVCGEFQGIGNVLRSKLSR